jgi:hypothetical protein
MAGCPAPSIGVAQPATNALSRFSAAIDAAPLHNDFFRPVDHNGCFVSEHVVAPLCRPDNEDGIGLALADAESIAGPAYGWDLHLKELNWSRAVPLDAAAVARRLRAYFMSGGTGSRRGHFAFPSQPDISVLDSRTVRVRLPELLSYLALLLGLPQVAPEPPPGMAGASLGAYTWIEAPPIAFEMSRNPSRPDLVSADLPATVSAVVVADGDAAVRMFDHGEIAMTATTGFSSAVLDSVKGRSDLHNRALNIFGHLEFGRGAQLFRRRVDLRRSLASILDPVAIIAPTAGLLEVHPDAAILPRHGDASVAAVGSALRQSAEIVYADFPPNGVVVDGLIAQVSNAFGVTLVGRPVSLCEYARMMATDEYALAYTLTVPEFDHEAAALMPWHSDCALGRRAELRDRVLDELLESAAYSISDDPNAWGSARSRLLEWLPRIPLTRVLAQFLIADSWRDLALTKTGTITVNSYHDLAAARQPNQCDPPTARFCSDT